MMIKKCLSSPLSFSVRQPYNLVTKSRSSTATFRHQLTYTYYKDNPIRVPIWSLKPGGLVGEQALDPFVFNCAPRADILHRVVVWHLACRRMGLAKQKDRSEVAYSGRKIRKQKGTGKARLGSRGSPNLIGGGRAHPKRPTDYSFELPEEVRVMALRMVLTLKLITGRLVVVDGLPLVGDSLLEFKSLVKPWLPTWREQQPFAAMRGVAVVEGGTFEAPQAAAMRNALEATKGERAFKVMSAADANVFDLMRLKYLIVTTGALRQLHAFFYPYKMRQAPPWYVTAHPIPLPIPDTTWIYPGPKVLTAPRMYSEAERQAALDLLRHPPSPSKSLGHC